MPKKITLLIILSLFISIVCHAQNQRKVMLEQIAKLQVYLGYLKKGYNIVQRGLTLIGDIKDGDFNLHRLFYDRLKQVNPKIKQYGKVADIISMQVKLLATFKRHFKEIRQSGMFSQTEIDYLHRVFTSLIDNVDADIQLLTTVLTDGLFEMQDNERIELIDGLHISISEKYNSFFSFRNKISLMAGQRKHELKDLQTLKQLYIP